VKTITGTTKKVSIDEKQVVFYNEAYAKRAKAEREATIMKARDLVNNPSKYNQSTSHGAAKYVKNLTYDAKTGELITMGRTLVFNENKLREEELYDGYFSVVTSEYKKTDREIIDIYHGLWKIEESFKVTKSDLETRPIYLSREDHIQAHFLVCFIALVIARLLEYRLHNRFTIAQIAESLGKTSCSHIERNWYLCDYYDDITDAINNYLGIDLRKKYLSLGDIKNIIGTTKKVS